MAGTAPIPARLNLRAWVRRRDTHIGSSTNWIHYSNALDCFKRAGDPKGIGWSAGTRHDSKKPQAAPTRQRASLNWDGTVSRTPCGHGPRCKPGRALRLRLLTPTKTANARSKWRDGWCVPPQLPAQDQAGCSSPESFWEHGSVPSTYSSAQENPSSSSSSSGPPYPSQFESTPSQAVSTASMTGWLR